MEKNEIAVFEEIKRIILSGKPNEEIIDLLGDYHENDIACVVEELEKPQRQRLFEILGARLTAEILAYTEDISEYLEEMSPKQAAEVLENLDADDAVDALESIENDSSKKQLISLMDNEAIEDIRLIKSFDDDEIGSMMTTNYVTVFEGFTIKEAMRSVIEQAPENDNISTIYAVDENNRYAGAIDLKDLIIARKNTALDDIISRGYPSVLAEEKISDAIEGLKDYSEDSIPVLNSNDEIIGAITAEDIIEAVDEQMNDDYAKLAGLTSEEDLKENIFDSLKKRLPWLVLLLGLGLIVSSVVGIFEGIVAKMAIVVCFQSLILDMAGNVGTQSLAVTIRVLMDEGISGKTKLMFVLKEMRIAGTNGLLLGTLSFVFVGFYLNIIKHTPFSASFAVSGCVGLALFLAMTVSGLIGTLTPMLFHKIKIDPAVASGPLITTVNDLVAVVTYYSLAGLMLSGMNIQ